MRLLYFILYPTLTYALRVFYSSIRKVNAPKNFFGRTIYVVNHPASFMDPLVVAALQNPIVFFMTRADIFNKFTRPLLWSCHMLPIYRQHDGGDTKRKNEEVFKKCSRILSFGRNLLIFGEGFTDDTFIRRLKPVKKGAAKIGFSTLENINWSKKIYMSAVGVNYSSPNQMRSHLLISNSDKFCLNDYRELYEENPNKAITEVTQRIELLMQEQITHVENKELAPFHEKMMSITREGFHPRSFNSSKPLIKRWEYSRSLAKWLNKKDIDSDQNLQALKRDTDEYFKDLEKSNLEDKDIFWKKERPTGGTRLGDIAFLFLLSPIMILGLVHCFIPYIITKKFVEKSFRRDVFWGSVKLIVGILLIAIFNIPTFFLFHSFIYPSWGLATAYWFTIGITGGIAYIWFMILKRYKTKGRLNNMDLKDIINTRDSLEKRINEMVGSLD